MRWSTSSTPRSPCRWGRCRTGSAGGRCCSWPGGVYVAVYAGFAVASGAVALIALFALYGVYFAAGEGVIKAWIAGLVPPDRRRAAYGLYAAAAGLMVLPASLLAGGLWDRVGPGWAFGVGAVIAAVALGIVVISPSLRAAARAEATSRAG